MGRPVSSKAGKIKCHHTGNSSAASQPDKGFPHQHPKLLRRGWGDLLAHGGQRPKKISNHTETVEEVYASLVFRKKTDY